MNTEKKTYLSIFLCLLWTMSLIAQVNFNGNTNQILIDFDSTVMDVNKDIFSGSGLDTNPNTGQLDGDAWRITGMSDGNHNYGDTNTSGDYARGTSSGGVSAGGIYAFELVNGNYAMGIQSTGSDVTPGTITLKVDNNTSSAISQIDISYNIYVRNDKDRSNGISFYYSFDDINYTTDSNLDFASPGTADNSPTWVMNPRNITLTNITFPQNSSFYIRWALDDISGSGSRDELAIDDISINIGGNNNSCTEPNTQPFNLTFSTVTHHSIEAQFSSVPADKYMIIRSDSSLLDSYPIDGVCYDIGAPVGTGQVIQFDPDSSFIDTGLEENTTYHYYLYSTNDNCIVAPEYKNDNPLTASISTTSNNNSDYYNGLSGLTCETLKTALHDLIDDHTEQSYGSLWTIFQNSDDRINDAGTQTIVWDMYSDNPAGAENEFIFVTDQCGTYSNEGMCYNREHTFPRSYWGGSTSVPQYTDLFHVIPADGYLNGIRSNLPYSEVEAGTETYTSANGSKRGSSLITIPGYSGAVFEPIDEFKGDIARNYFYIATRYQDVIASWENNNVEVDAILDGSSYVVFEQWFLDMLITWHNDDPVSAKEIARNDTIYTYQGNRNPFIDHPEYVDLIWLNCSDNEAPTAPTNLTASNITSQTVDLTWNASTDNVGVDVYNIYQDNVLIGSSSGTNYNVTGLNPSTAYDFYINAVDAAGNVSPNSNTVNITTDTNLVEVNDQLGK